MKKNFSISFGKVSLACKSHFWFFDPLCSAGCNKKQPSFQLSLSLSLSHTHTHTHTQCLIFNCSFAPKVFACLHFLVFLVGGVGEEEEDIAINSWFSIRSPSSLRLSSK